MHNTVKHILNGISRVQNIFLWKPGFCLIEVYYDNYTRICMYMRQNKTPYSLIYSHFNHWTHANITMTRKKIAVVTFYNFTRIPPKHFSPSTQWFLWNRVEEQSSLITVHYVFRFISLATHSTMSQLFTSLDLPQSSLRTIWSLLWRIQSFPVF
jgi:hypothetical protein